jgi:hypothetical protein
MTRQCPTCTNYFDTLGKELFCSRACRASAPQEDTPAVRVKQHRCIRCRILCDNTSAFCGDLCREEYRAIGLRLRKGKRAA